MHTQGLQLEILGHNLFFLVFIFSIIAIFIYATLKGWRCGTMPSMGHRRHVRWACRCLFLFSLLLMLTLDCRWDHLHAVQRQLACDDL
jgi:TRAP-type mannitol/chloroaromatic compound transport system permease small subunit